MTANIGRGGTTSRRRRGGSRWKSIVVPLAAAACVLLLGALLSSLSLVLGAPVMKAAIIDQLNLTYASPEFIQHETAILKQAGYAADYYPPQRGNIEFYRRLPTLGYQIIILRVHTPRLKEANGELGDEVALVTSDIYRPDKPVDKKLAPYLVKVLSLNEWPATKQLYGITDGFVRDQMEGNFQGATIILTGCSGLRSDKLAKSFVSKGAGAVIGWDADVAPAFTDSATELLLQHLLIDKIPTREAVSRAAEKAGVDPYYGGRLVSYPPGR
ncbi:MAG: hypothetical protein EPO21_01590 [Chloroflexota bacterium]|nr:MAG: hypothetical protein EPO21_01590 [Chloroflexota bacterium]